MDWPAATSGLGAARTQDDRRASASGSDASIASDVVKLITKKRISAGKPRNTSKQEGVKGSHSEIFYERKRKTAAKRCGKGGWIGHCRDFLGPNLDHNL